MRYFVALLYGLLATSVSGCGEAPQSIIEGTVLEVRITAGTVHSKQGATAGGALAGGMIAGPTGAIVGAIIGSSDEKVAPKEEALGCRLFVKANDNDYFVFTTIGANNPYTLDCSLYRKGDHFEFKKIIQDGPDLYMWSLDNRMDFVRGSRTQIPQ